MKAILGLTVAAGLAFAASAVSAATYDFIDAIDNGPLGESYYSTLTTGDYAYFTGPSISITAQYAGDPTVYVYADSDTAGLGVCRDASGGTGARPGNTTNLCNPSSDDSIQSVFSNTGQYLGSEYLTLTFNEDTYLTSITVNANHDGPLTTSDYIWIWDGAWTPVQTAILTEVDGKSYFTYYFDKFFSAGSFISLGGDCNNIYLSALEASPPSVPAPAAGIMLLTGLGGMAAMRRRRKAA